MIAVQIRNPMGGDDFTIPIEYVATVGHLKKTIVAAGQATNLERIRLCLVNEAVDDSAAVNFVELYPDDRRLDRCGVVDKTKLCMLIASEPEIYSLLSNVQAVGQITCKEEKKNEYHIQLDDLGSLGSGFNLPHTISCVEQLDIRDIIYFTVNINAPRYYLDTPELVFSQKRAIINIGDIQFQFGSSFVFSYDGTKGQLAAMRIPQFKDSVKETKLTYMLQSANPEASSANTLSFSINWAMNRAYKMIVTESTRAQIDKITNLISKYTGSTDQNSVIEVFS